ncbi:Gfo/Idh/MocA family protein [Gorillibacterium timonense]|uniref:Gfo/Idh/MocA family protein n=1 Tax=Gorillibacterium timonense TaxID=1689269 RepID=UPI00071CAAF2|nr:Gfo/Idh/MocA family oxidoreductase [Gorillibacterium timonense]
MMKAYGVVLIGCGSMGATHLDTLHAHPRVRLVGVVDLMAEKANRFADRYEAESWGTDYRCYLTRSDVDIVIIATYPSSHLVLTRECLAAGKHVLCEKPMAGSLQEAAEMVRLGSSSRSKLLIGHILRHNTTYQFVRDLIHSGAIGGPIVMRMSQIKNPAATWNSHLALLHEVSPIVDCGVHYVDVMRWFTGAEVLSVSGFGQRLDPDIPVGSYNYGMISLKLSDGSVGFYEAGWGHTMATDNLKEFVGPLGRIRITYQSHRATPELGNLVEVHYSDGRTEEINIPFEAKPTDLQFDYLLRMIEEQLDPKPMLRDFYRALEVTILGDRAIHEEKPIHCLDRLPEIVNF